MKGYMYFTQWCTGPKQQEQHEKILHTCMSSTPSCPEAHLRDKMFTGVNVSLSEYLLL